MLHILLLYTLVQGADIVHCLLTPKEDNQWDIPGMTYPGAKSSWECIGLDGERVPNGETFVPGPDYCTVCKCDEGKARVCQAVLCQPPQDCKSFRLGQKCCDFICLDDMLPNLPDGNGNNQSTDLGLRMVASAVTAILSLALLLFLIHRLRQRRIRAQQQYYEDQLDSPVGPNYPDPCHNNACCHNAAYCNGNDHVDFFLDGHTPPYSLWKPPSFYFPHEDAPPPYSEVVGSSYRLSEASNSLPALGPLMVQLGPPPGESSDTSGGALALIGAIGGSYRRPCSSSHTLHNIYSESAKGRHVALRSDEMYEEVDGIPEDLPPPYYPPVQPLNDLNRVSEARPVEEVVPVCNDAECSGVAATQECVCGANDPSCSLCAVPEHDATSNDKTVQQPSVSPVRMRSREHRSSVVQREGDRTSTLEEFQLCLAMDISDSSTSSDVPTRTFSSSSEDSTSMDTTSEMR